MKTIRQFFISAIGVLASAASIGAANLTAADLMPNDLVITEYLANPIGVSDADGEYFEIFNTTASAIDLAGIVVRDDGSNEFALTELIIEPLSYAVLGTVNDGGLGFVPDFLYGGGMALTNTDDEIAIYRPDDELIHKIAYDDGDFFGAGVAHELGILNSLTPGITAGPSLGSDFVAASLALSNGNFGSPGVAGNTFNEFSIVPVPSAAWLFGAALSALAWTRRAACRQSRGQGSS